MTTILPEGGQRVLTFPVSGIMFFGNPEYQPTKNTTKGRGEY
jgi:hypothetical protein